MCFQESNRQVRPTPSSLSAQYIISEQDRPRSKYPQYCGLDCKSLPHAYCGSSTVLTSHIITHFCSVDKMLWFTKPETWESWFKIQEETDVPFDDHMRGLTQPCIKHLLSVICKLFYICIISASRVQMSLFKKLRFFKTLIFHFLCSPETSCLCRSRLCMEIISGLRQMGLEIPVTWENNIVLPEHWLVSPSFLSCSLTPHVFLQFIRQNFLYVYKPI